MQDQCTLSPVEPTAPGLFSSPDPGGPAVTLLLYVIALALLILAAAGVPAGRVALGWAGMAVWLFTAAVLPALGAG